MVYITPGKSFEWYEYIFWNTQLLIIYRWGHILILNDFNILEYINFTEVHDTWVLFEQFLWIFSTEQHDFIKYVNDLLLDLVLVNFHCDISGVSEYLVYFVLTDNHDLPLENVFKATVNYLNNKQNSMKRIAVCHIINLLG